MKRERVIITITKIIFKVNNYYLSKLQEIGIIAILKIPKIKMKLNNKFKIKNP